MVSATFIVIFKGACRAATGVSGVSVWLIDAVATTAVATFGLGALFTDSYLSGALVSSVPDSACFASAALAARVRVLVTASSNGEQDLTWDVEFYLISFSSYLLSIHY